MKTRSRDHIKRYNENRNKVEGKLANGKNSDLFIFPDGAVFNKKTKQFVDTFTSNWGYNQFYWRDTKKTRKGKLRTTTWRLCTHRLVASKYCGGKFRDNLKDLVGDHIDANKSNNNAENLRWMTAEENHQQFIKYQKHDFR